jgi:hypothetical protein
MKDTSLYQQILGDTSPWSVSEVQLNADTLTIEVRLTLAPETLWACPECRSRIHVKEWRSGGGGNPRGGRDDGCQ